MVLLGTLCSERTLVLFLNSERNMIPILPVEISYRIPVDFLSRYRTYFYFVMVSEVSHYSP